METTHSPDGTRIAFSRSGSGPALVLVHGTAGDHTRWAPVRPRLEEHFTVVAMDRRGRGASGDAKTYALEREFEDVVAVVDAVGEDVVLLGHSFGGILALEAALQSERVRRLILYEPPIPWQIVGPELFDENAIAQIEHLLAEGRNEEAAVFFMRDVVRLPPEQLQAIRSAPSWPGRVAAAVTIPREERAPMGYRYDAARFAGMDIPVLLLQGGASPDWAKQATRALHEAIPGSEVAVLEGQGHVGDYSAPGMFASKVVGFGGGA